MSALSCNSHYVSSVTMAMVGQDERVTRTSSSHGQPRVEPTLDLFLTEGEGDVNKHVVGCEAH